MGRIVRFPCAGSQDQELHSILLKDEINTWYMGSKTMDQSTVKNDFGWGSPKFHKMGRDKIRLIRDFTMVGVDVLISDIDVVWLENPLPYFERYPLADMLVSTGAPPPLLHVEESGCEMRASHCAVRALTPPTRKSAREREQ